MGLHVAGLSICLWLRRLRRSDRAWLVGLFPDSYTYLAIALRGRSYGPRPCGWSEGVELCPCGLELDSDRWRSWKLTALIGGSDSEFAVDFAAASNSTVLALLPLSPFLLDRSAAPYLQ